MKTDLKSLTLEELTDLVLESGGKKFHAKYIFSFIHEKHVVDINLITPISAALRDVLIADGAFISTLTLVTSEQDPDGTKKYLFETAAGKRFETALLTDDGRRTICLSSQVGCKMGCEFCATAKMGFAGDLSTGEILEQFYAVSEIDGKISNVVFMGMGEPFDNYDSVMKAAMLLNHPSGANVGARHITISTCGMPAEIDKFAEVEQQFRLAVSLHSPREQSRVALMPIAARYGLKTLFESVRNYYKKTGRRITIEYCMMAGVNDTPADASALARLLNSIKCNVNLIEFNPYPGSEFEASSPDTIKAFSEVLEKAGIETHIRYRRGRAIKAACGQLGAGWAKKQ
ncbi:MAG: 23S rRNA (adenine(2503)-C(2))-methyltransferase RlmN [Phycisphaerae bacterium]